MSHVNHLVTDQCRIVPSSPNGAVVVIISSGPPLVRDDRKDTESESTAVSAPEVLCQGFLISPVTYGLYIYIYIYIIYIRGGARRCTGKVLAMHSEGLPGLWLVAVGFCHDSDSVHQSVKSHRTAPALWAALSGRWAAG